MTSSGKVRIYELSRDLGLDNRDVLEAAEKLAISVKSHSSSISDDEAARIRGLIESGSGSRPTSASAPTKPSPAPAAPASAILAVRKPVSGSETPAVAPPAPPRPPAVSKPTAPS
ncbi:MAG: translation initiation factor IF-2 N-terminal domain-containing protein, partial [Cyanobacteriota bacterium]